MRRQPVFARVTLVLVLVVLLAPRCTWAFAVHLGCFSTGLDNGLDLNFKAADSASMTIEACRALAQARLATTFGLAGGTQCLLDPQGDTTTALPRSAAGGELCSTQCSGDSRIVCGGAQHLNLFLENNPAAPAVVPGHAYAPAGCFRDDASARRMALLWQSGRMSIDLCAHIAFTEQWPVFALEGGSACYGAQALEPVKGLGQSGTCTLACEGEATQYCGGLSALNAYTLTNTAAPWVNTSTISNQPSALQDSGSSSGSSAGAAQAAAQVQSGAGSLHAGPRLTTLAAAVLGGAVLLWAL